MSELRPAIAHPAATVVLLRDGGAGCEVLLVRRNAQLVFHGGAWVFPGGRLDAGGSTRRGGGDTVAAAQRAAVREAREEAGLTLAPDALVLVSRWITPATAAEALRHLVLRRAWATTRRWRSTAARFTTTAGWRRATRSRPSAPVRSSCRRRPSSPSRALAPHRRRRRRARGLRAGPAEMFEPRLCPDRRRRGDALCRRCRLRQPAISTRRPAAPAVDSGRRLALRARGRRSDAASPCTVRDTAVAVSLRQRPGRRS